MNPATQPPGTPSPQANTYAPVDTNDTAAPMDVQRESSSRVVRLMVPILVVSLIAMSVAFWFVPNGKLSAASTLAASFVAGGAGVLNRKGYHRAAAGILAGAAIVIPMVEPVTTGNMSTNAFFVGVACVLGLLVVQKRYRWWVIAGSTLSLTAMIVLTTPESTVAVARPALLVSGAALFLLSLTSAFFLLRTFDRMAEQAVATQLVASRQAAEISAVNDQITAAIAQRTVELAEAIEARKALARRLQESVVRDPLTGLLNRRYLDQNLDRILGPTAAVAILDVDYFKLINDRLSYSVGDAVLQEIASILASSVRDGDLVARYGGEEFALLMPGTTAAAAPRVVDDVRARVAAHDWTSIHPELSVTMSAGICAHTGTRLDHLATREPGQTALAMLSRADQALRAAKSQGRDRTAMARL